MTASEMTTTRSGRTLRERLLSNPVVLKELRGRMRGARAFIVLTVYLLLMSGFATLVYVLYASSLSFNVSGPQGGQIGRVLFISVVGVELFLVTFIAPAFASGAISGERERQTYDLLRTTLLPSRALVGGKLISTLSYIFLLLLTAIPLQGIAFLFGGVTEMEIILSFVILVVTAVLLGTVGVFFSAITRRTLVASVLSYAFALITVLVLPLVLMIVGPMLGGLFIGGGNISPALEAAFYYGLGLLIATNPLGTLIGTLLLLIERQEIGFFTVTLTSNGASIPLVSPWIVFTILGLAVSAILLLVAIKRVNRIDET